MIVITNWKDVDMALASGDSFVMRIYQDGRVVNQLYETLVESKIINFMCTFRFCKENGEVSGFHFSGLFGNTEDMPEEIVNAKRIKDLTEEQRDNFMRTVGTR